MTPTNSSRTAARNAPCPCGSGKKYKRCCGAGMQDAAVSVAADLGLLVRHYQQGNLQAAAHLADLLLRKEPDNPDLLEIAAAVAAESGNAELAAARFRQQLALQPDNALAHSNLCMVLHSLGRDKEAYSAGQRAIELDPRLADAWNNLGNIFKAGNHLEGALEHYEKALQLDDSNPHTLVNAGMTSQLLGDLDTAERRYRAALALHPGFAPACNNLATVLQKMERYPEADAAYRKALELQPHNPETLVNYGSMLLDKGDTQTARAFFDKAIQEDPGHVGAWISMANLHEKLDDQDAAARHYAKALSLDPENSTVHCNLGYRMYELGEQKQAIGHFVRALKSNPNSAKALAGLGMTMLRQDEVLRAAEYIGKALELAPRDAHTRLAYATLLDSRHKREQAEAEWRYVIDNRPGMTEAYIGLASNYAIQSRYEQARSVYRDAVARQAANADLYHAWSQMEEKVHQLDDAEQLAEKARALDPAYPGLAILKAKLARRRKDYASALGYLEEIDRKTIIAKQTRANYLFELGTINDKLGNYVDAFAAYEEANTAKNEYAGRTYDRTDDMQKFDRWKQFLSPETWRDLSRNAAAENSDYPRPVFIVGFPRSGTSLLEQIVGAHHQIAPAGELVYIGDLVREEAGSIIGSKLEYPEFLRDPNAPLTDQKLQVMRDYYLSSTRKLAIGDGSTRWITDKMPHNSTVMALIALLFPQSPIIHIVRHPLNSCLSAYFSDFNAAHGYSSSLENTAWHFRYVMDLIEHYRSIGIKILRVRYEDLVMDQEAITRRILDYIGAPWDEACMQHHKSKRIVKTVSYEQVTEKIYTSSLYRYRNYYDAVRNIIPILESTIKRYGYTLD